MYPNTLTHFDRSLFRRGAARSNIAYARRPASVPLPGATIGERLRAAVERRGERDALVVTHQAFAASYGALWHEVDRAARALMASGVASGDRVGVHAPSRWEWVVVQLAAARAGAILVPVDPATSARDLASSLASARVSVLVTSRGSDRAASRRELATLRGECPELRETIVLEDDWSAFLARGEAVGDGELARREAGIGADDPAVMLHAHAGGFAGGSLLSHRAVLEYAQVAGDSLTAGEGDRTCVPVPLYHCFGLAGGVLGAVLSGGCVVLPSASFEPGAVLAAVEAERCTVLLGVESMFIALLEHPGFERFELSSLRAGTMGGAPFPAEIIRRARVRLDLDELAIVPDPPALQARPARRRRELRMGMIQRYAMRGIGAPEPGL